MTRMWNEIQEQPVVLERCFEKNRTVFKEIINALSLQEINTVFIAARGTSDHAAVYAKYAIEYSTAIPVALAAPSVFTMYGRSIRFRNTLVIAISQSGKAADALEVIREANRQGAVTIGITNSPGSPIAKECRFHLCCEAGKELSVAATKTFTAQVFLLAHLVSEWVEDRKMQQELLSVPERIAHTLKSADIIEEKVPRYRFMDECFIMARGFNYPVALEAALKLQETCYVHAKAFATSDFYHGPFAMIERGFPVIVFAPEGPSFNDVSKMIDRLVENQVELLVVSNKKELLELGNCGFTIPETDNDMISPFFNTVVAQMFACKLSIVKGLDPDSPRGLNKVTITR